MKDIIPTYACVVAKEIDNNFYNNKIYIMFESTYESRKKSIDEAEAIIVWPYLKQQKYINPNYIWKIKSKWKYNVIYNEENKKFDIDIVSKSVEDLDDDFLKRLTEVHEIQQKYFNEKFDHLSSKNKYYFIEVQKINPYDQCNACFKEKTLFYLNEYFEKDWALIDKFDNFRYFKFNTDTDFFYDIKKEVFILKWSEEEFYFKSPTHRDNLNKLMRLLIKERERTLSNNEIYNNLGIKIEKKTSSDKLADLKKYISKLFNNDLWFWDDIIENQILMMRWHDWFKIIWKLITNKEFTEINNTSEEN